MTMTEWLSTFDYPPNWGDGGPIELRRENGSVVRTWLGFDCYFSGEDEVPIPYLDNDLYFYDFVEWRRVDKRK